MAHLPIRNHLSLKKRIDCWLDFGSFMGTFICMRATIEFDEEEVADLMRRLKISKRSDFFRVLIQKEKERLAIETLIALRGAAPNLKCARDPDTNERYVVEE
ncbi:MAG: hypothetical protein EOO40_06950 [Deltaproteobacteria bacterium]|nr:MAG: hypothetical protein EOO40_06950 [Deltaproteobacteria bacterium]